MARSRSAPESIEDRIQVPAERPEDSLDGRDAELRKADDAIAKEYPEKTDDVRADDSKPAIASDDSRLTGEGSDTSDSSE